MNISTVDWIIIIVFFLITLGIGVIVSKRAGSNTKEYFLSGRNLPWWLLGISMVATTFSADTPNLVTDIIRKDGVAGNWVWWAFLLTGMTTVFIYARLWRRSGITTDLEFYELRYSGQAATFLRAFRSVYLGVFFNVMIMATVMLAGIKIAGIMLGFSPIQTVLLVSIITVVYSTLGGLRGVVLTDFFQFTLSMIGMIAAAIYIVNLPEIESLSGLINHESVTGKIALIPDLTNPEIAVPLFFVPLAVQWWSTWYPGAEPGGGGYVAQRMLSARNENDAVKATLLFNLAHYALRPWPWILIALASLIIFPTMQDIAIAFPDIDPGILKDDIAFPAMLSLLPKGLLGLVIAALLAALMSTISTHLNWGASYMVNDLYLRFFDQQADEKTQVKVGRISTVVLMILAATFALFLTNALQAFSILLQIGAGTGLLFLLRWFWWRINAYSEISAMVISFMIAIYFELIYSGDLLPYQRMVIGVGITTVVWVVVTLLTRPTEMQRLQSFYTMIRPYGWGWKTVTADMIQVGESETADVGMGVQVLQVFLGCVMVYGFLFATGYFLYGQMGFGIAALMVSLLCALGLKTQMQKV